MLKSLLSQNEVVRGQRGAPLGRGARLQLEALDPLGPCARPCVSSSFVSINDRLMITEYFVDELLTSAMRNFALDECFKLGNTNVGKNQSPIVIRNSSCRVCTLK